MAGRVVELGVVGESVEYTFLLFDETGYRLESKPELRPGEWLSMTEGTDYEARLEEQPDGTRHLTVTMPSRQQQLFVRLSLQP